VAYQVEQRVGKQMKDVGAATGEEIIDAEDLVSMPQQGFAKVRADEPCATGHQYRSGQVHLNDPLSVARAAVSPSRQAMSTSALVCSGDAFRLFWKSTRAD
jgi:hypothetical protein